MSKQLLVKVAVAIVAVSAMTLLQGCEDEEDGMVVSFAWAPAGMAPIPQPAFASVGAATSTGGTTTSTTSSSGGGTP